MQVSETESAVQWVRLYVPQWPERPSIDLVNELLRRLGRWRSRLLANTFVRHHGATILQGPFAGMAYVSQATEGALIPRLIGSYESELHPYLERFSQDGVEVVIDVGCAEGYYAVGLARMLPNATVYAFDIDPAAREACAELAARNGVSDRVVVGAEFGPTSFEAFAGRNALVIMDTEGAEDDLLRPDLSPALAGMRLIVETHPTAPNRAGVTERVRERFEPTHRVTKVLQGPKSTPLPPWFDELGHLDHLLAVWEWRGAPTPWLVMEPKGA